MRIALLVVIAICLIPGGCSPQQLPEAATGNPPEKKTAAKKDVPTVPTTGTKHGNIVVDERILRSLPSPIAKDETIRLGVVEFQNTGKSVRNAKMGGAAAALLIDRLARHGKFRIVERAGAKELLREKSIPTATPASKTEAISAPGTVTSDFVVTGTFEMDVADGTFVISLVDISDGKPVAEWTARGPAAEMSGIATHLVNGLERFFGFQGEPTLAETKAPPSQSPFVAVLKLSNVGPSTRLQPMEDGFGDILQANLSAIDGVQLVERQRIRDVLQEQNLGLSGAVDPTTAARVGQLVGAQQLVYGSFFELNKVLHVQVRLIDVQTTAVLQSASVQGDAGQFEPMMLELTKRIGAALSNLPSDLAERVQQKQPAHALESALHYARGQDFERLGRLDAAAAAYAEATIIEPANPQLHLQRCQALFRRRAYPELITAAEQALQQDFPEEKREFYRWSLYAFMINSSWGTRNFSRMSELARQAMAEFKDPVMLRSATYAQAVALVGQGHWDEGTQLLEKTSADAKGQQENTAYLEALHKLLQFYQSESHPSGRGPDRPEQRQEAVRRALRVYSDLLQAISGRRDEEAMRIGINAYYLGTFIGREDRGDPVAGQEQELKILQSAMKALDWIPRIAAEANFQLAEILEDREQWEEALEAHRKFQQADYVAHDSFPCIYDVQSVQPNSWLDKHIESSYRIGKILEIGLDRKDEAGKAYQEFIQKHGVANFRGHEVVAGLYRLGLKLNHPANCVLVWGGATDVRSAYAKLLAEDDCVVHSVRTQHMTLAHLLPYPLIVLARPGDRIYTPGEILALRSYVATGGSLLVIVSPGWEPAAPSLHSSLLSFFGASVGDRFADREGSTEIIPHAITGKLRWVRVRNPVGLKVPTEAQLIRWKDDTVLAAMNNGRGRVILAAFGQWYLPGFDEPNEWQRHRLGSHWTAQVHPDKLPIEMGYYSHRPLLKNALTWLRGNSELDAESQACRQALHDAAETAIAVEASALPGDVLQPELSKLEGASKDPLWREELLWSAGELSQQLRYELAGRQYMQYCVAPSYGDGNEWSLAQGEYYQRLIEQFPTSPLRPFAEWRLGECARRAELAVAMKERPRSSVFPHIDEADTKAPLAAFAKVMASEGTYAWAWTQIRIGKLHAQSGDIQSAANCFENVAEQMPKGPEKVLALLSLGHCYFQLGRKDDAIRQFELVTSFPSIQWDLKDPYANWQPVLANTWAPSESHAMATSALRTLARKK